MGGDLYHTYTEGLGLYFLKNMNQAVLCGDGILSMVGHNTIELDPKKLGLQSRPHYFKKLAVSYSHFEHNFWGQSNKQTASDKELMDKFIAESAAAAAKSTTSIPEDMRVDAKC